MKYSKEKGITLIALVITIIVLLILAGVSIAMLTGQNGILTQATSAKEKANKATEEEKIQMAVLGSSLTDSGYNAILDETSFKQELANQFGSQSLDVVANGDGSFIITIEDTQRKYYVNDDKTVINSDNIIEIGTAEELASFRNDVNNGNTYEEKAILLTNNIDLQGEEWEPIGYYPPENVDSPNANTNKPFKGIFDGCGYEINNFYIDTTEKVQGLFGLVNNAKIANLGVGENVSINGGIGTAGVVSYIYNRTKVYNCYNKARIKGNDNHTGGVVGISHENNQVSNCYNLGKIDGTINVGGIVGYLNTSSVLSNCYNNGNITASQSWVGGIVGQAQNSSIIETSYNRGSIYGESDDTGGIAGKLFTNCIVRNCYNIGEVTGNGDYIGGLVGLIQNSSAENCYNIGIINGDNATGINSAIGFINVSTVNNCYVLERWKL